jgi:hypothetical protein
MAFTERFQEYFRKEAAVQAAGSLGNGVEIEIQVDGETFYFTKEKGQNQVKPGSAPDPEILFNLTPAAAEQILADPAEDVGTIGVNIAKLVVSTDARKRVGVKFKAGFLRLWSKGYFGVLKAGGTQFASYLASRGLSGIDAIKSMLGKLKG